MQLLSAQLAKVNMVHVQLAKVNVVHMKLQGLGLNYPVCCLGIAAVQRTTGFFQLAINGKFGSHFLKVILVFSQ